MIFNGVHRFDFKYLEPQVLFGIHSDPLVRFKLFSIFRVRKMFLCYCCRFYFINNCVYGKFPETFDDSEISATAIS